MTYRSRQTLGTLISDLEQVDRDARICLEGPEGPENPDGVNSWRGDYSELMIERGGTKEWTVGQLLAELKGAEGRTFEGYKGGYYTMDLDTRVWIDTYGSSACIAAAEVVPHGMDVVLIRGFYTGY